MCTGKREVGGQRRCAYMEIMEHTGMGNERSSLTTGGTKGEGARGMERQSMCVLKLPRIKTGIGLWP